VKQINGINNLVQVQQYVTLHPNLPALSSELLFSCCIKTMITSVLIISLIEVQRTLANAGDGSKEIFGQSKLGMGGRVPSG
jgi:hypothetical protein